MYHNNNNTGLNCNNHGGKMPIASQTQRLGEAEKNLKGARECIARHFVAFATKECKWQRLTSNLRTQSQQHACMYAYVHISGVYFIHKNLQMHRKP